jgi:hypothetical protein
MSDKTADAEAKAISSDYQKKYDDLTNQLAIQQKSIDTMNNIQDKVGGIKDDLIFSVKTFKKQIGDIRNQINIDKHDQVKKVNETVSWLDSILNFLVIAALLVAIVAVFRSLYNRYALASGTTIVPTG